MTDTLLDHALALAQRGIPVFPCIGGGKLPAIKGWRNLATTDERQIRDWWRHRRYNIGVAPGYELPGGGFLVVVDLDDKDGKSGSAELAALEQAHCALPPTFTVTTASGGRHLYFRHYEPVKNSVGRVAPGIDIRGLGGLAVGPGSRIATGGRYSVTGETETIAELPEWFAAHLTRHVERERGAGQIILGELDTPANIAAATAYLLDEAPEAIEGDGGDITTVTVAMRVGDFGVSEAATLELMLDHWNEQKASPPWPPEDLAVKVTNAWRYRQNPVGIANPANDLGAVGELEEMPLLPAVSLEEGQKILAESAAAFWSDVNAAWRQFEAERAEARGDVKPAETGLPPDASGLFDTPSPIEERESPRHQWPVHLWDVSPGVGKTNAILEGAAAGKVDGLLVFAMQQHSQAEEMAAKYNRLRPPGAPEAVVYRGTERPDPERPGSLMCRTLDAAAKLRAKGATQEQICARCRFRPVYGKSASGDVCGYQRQAHQDRPKVAFVPQALLAHTPPPFLAHPRALVLDESPINNLLRGVDKRKREDVPVSDLLESRRLPGAEADALRYTAMQNRLRELLEATPSGKSFTREAIDRVGLAARDCFRMAKDEWRFRQAPILPDPASDDGPAPATLTLLANNALAQQRAIFWGLLGRAIRDDQGVVVRLRVIHREAAPGDVVRMVWREDIRDGWHAPTLYMDGTMDVHLARHLFSRANEPVSIRVETPHVRYTYVPDGPGTHRALDPSHAKTAKEHTTQKNHRRHLSRLIEVEAEKIVRRGGVPGAYDLLVVTLKAAVPALHDEIAAYVPRFVDRLGLAHYGALRGLNAYQNVATVIMAGRLQPPAAAMEEVAAALTGLQPATILGAGIYPEKPARVFDANGQAHVVRVSYHPDPIVDALLRQARDGEMVQCEARGRGVRRTADNPLEVIQVGGPPLRRTYDRIASYAEIRSGDAGPAPLLQARGVVPQRLSDAAKALDPWFADAPNPANALRKYLDNNPSARAEWDTLHRAIFVANSGQTPISGQERFRLIHYRAAERRNWCVAAVDTVLHSAPEDALRKWLGDDLVIGEKHRKPRKAAGKASGTSALPAPLALEQWAPASLFRPIDRVTACGTLLPPRHAFALGRGASVLCWSDDDDGGSVQLLRGGANSGQTPISEAAAAPADAPAESAPVIADRNDASSGQTPISEPAPEATFTAGQLRQRIGVSSLRYRLETQRRLKAAAKQGVPLDKETAGIHALVALCGKDAVMRAVGR